MQPSAGPGFRSFRNLACPVYLIRTNDLTSETELKAIPGPQDVFLNMKEKLFTASVKVQRRKNAMVHYLSKLLPVSLNKSKWWLFGGQGVYFDVLELMKCPFNFLLHLCCNWRPFIQAWVWIRAYLGPDLQAAHIKTEFRSSVAVCSV